MEKRTNNKKKYLAGAFCLFLLSSAFVFLFDTSLSIANTVSFLDQKETTWLQQRQRPIKIGITSIPNQILMDENGGYKGFSIDLFQQIQEIIDIDFEYVYFETWSDVIDAGTRGSIDVVFLAQKTEPRLAHFDFTDAVLTQKNKIITKVGRSNDLTIEHLFGLAVAVSRGSALYEYLKHNFPSIKLVPTSNGEESLSYVSNNLADAAILESVRASYYLRKLNIENLRIAGDLGYDYHLRIASRKSLPILNIILTKAIDNINIEDIQALHLKWGYVKSKDGYFDKQTLIYFAIAFAVIIPFALYVSFLNKHLRMEIANKEKAFRDLRNAHDEIHHLKDVAESEARTDYLTNVLNNRGFREVLHNHIEKYRRTRHTFSLVLFDIDYFKKINDKMGHDTGDTVLSDFARLVKENLRTYDYMGRVGGEEFALIFPNTTLAEAVEITERIRTIISKHTFNANHFSFKITASFGVSEVTRGDSITTFFKRADELLYQSKSHGRNRVSS